ncbi:Hypothetical predicted protein [Mytilus galloprovincialis]|nr:Hypothetical predicted protein [Mytilus galloprovincialis]
MEKIFFVLIIVIIFHNSYQGPILRRCPSCSIVCNNDNINPRLRKQCLGSCQCEPKNIPLLVPVVLCPYKICKENCGFMGYKQDKMGCKSCECQEI